MRDEVARQASPTMPPSSCGCTHPADLESTAQARLRVVARNQVQRSDSCDICKRSPPQTQRPREDSSTGHGLLSTTPAPQLPLASTRLGQQPVTHRSNNLTKGCPTDEDDLGHAASC